MKIIIRISFLAHLDWLVKHTSMRLPLYARDGLTSLTTSYRASKHRSKFTDTKSVFQIQ